MLFFACLLCVVWFMFCFVIYFNDVRGLKKHLCRGVAPFTEMCMCVLEKLGRFFRDFLLLVNSICGEVSWLDLVFCIFFLTGMSFGHFWKWYFWDPKLQKFLGAHGPRPALLWSTFATRYICVCTPSKSHATSLLCATFFHLEQHSRDGIFNWMKADSQQTEF